MSVTGIATAVTEWVKIFPKQVTETYTGSVTFMKQLTVVAVSTISYLKNIFEEDNYTVGQFGGITLRILKQNCRDELAQFLSNALEQSFDAIDKKYLHQLALCFYEGKCKAQNLTEYHIFEFSYKSDEITMDIHVKSKDSAQATKISFNNVREQTISLIRKYCTMLQAYTTDLPEDCDISLRLYYNDDAPPGYQAPGFLSTTEAEDHIKPTLDNALDISFVQTPYHKFGVKFYHKRTNPDAEPSQGVTMVTQNAYSEDATHNETVSSGPADPMLECPCNLPVIEDNCLLLTCKYCGGISHGVCYGVTCAIDAHCCVGCSDTMPQFSPTDPVLAALTSNNKRECLCIFRQSLWWLSSLERASAAQLKERFLLTQLSVCKLMKKLHSSEIFVSGDDDDLITPRKINSENLKILMSKYIRNEEPNIVDRLLDETLSQQNQTDPVGEVLAPIEMISLQNATAMAKIVEHTPPDSSAEDSTLQQYRQAILYHDTNEEELPLSGNHNPVKDIEKIVKKTVKRKAEEPKPKTGVRSKRVKVAKKK